MNGKNINFNNKKSKKASFIKCLTWMILMLIKY